MQSYSGYTDAPSRLQQSESALSAASSPRNSTAQAATCSQTAPSSVPLYSTEQVHSPDIQLHPNITVRRKIVNHAHFSNPHVTGMLSPSSSSISRGNTGTTPGNSGVTYSHPTLDAEHGNSQPIYDDRSNLRSSFQQGVRPKVSTASQSA